MSRMFGQQPRAMHEEPIPHQKHGRYTPRPLYGTQIIR